MFGNTKPGDKFHELNEKFKLNTARLASYKAYHATTQLKQLTGDKDYEAKANLSLKRFNSYQLTEYNTLVSRARTAKQFIQFKNDADLYPCLEWIRSRSSDPREEHLAFVGLILPINDPFWSENQPGNLWNCKCDWKQVNASASEHKSKSVSPSVGLEGNPAETGELITDKHPYFSKIKNQETFIEVDKFAYNNYLKGEIKDNKQTIDPFNGKVIYNDNLATKKVTILRRSIDKIVSHTYEYKTRIASLFIEKDCQNWEYIGFVKAEAKHPEAAYFFYYKTTLNDNVVYMNVMLHKNYKSEVPYAILSSIQMKTIKKGLPNDIKDWIKK